MNQITSIPWLVASFVSTASRQLLRNPPSSVGTVPRSSRDCGMGPQTAPISKPQSNPQASIDLGEILKVPEFLRNRLVEYGCAPPNWPGVSTRLHSCLGPFPDHAQSQIANLKSQIP